MEAVFSISADIEPRIDQRALENQAQQLAKQMNEILGKQVDKVGLQGDTRSFNQIKEKVKDTSKATQALERSMGSLRNTIQSVPSRAREGFLKLSDAMGVTRRNVVGFGGSIRDIIRDTNKFEKALENIHVSGGVFKDLDESFSSTVASVRSGTSAIDQFADGGDRLARVFQPMTKVSAAAQLNMEGMQQTLEGLAGTFQDAFKDGGKKSADALDASSVSTGSLNAQLNQMQRTFLGLGKILPKGSAQQKAFFDTFEEAKAKGGMDDFVEGLVLQRDAASKLAGTLGKAKVALGLLSAEERDAAKILKTEINQELVKTEAQFPGTVQGFDRFAARVRNAKDSMVVAGDTFQKFQAGLAAIIPGENLGTSLTRAFDTTDAMGGASTFFDGLTNRFIALRATGKSVPEALGKAFKNTFGELNAVSTFIAKMDQVKATLSAVAVNTAFAAKMVKDTLAKSFEHATAVSKKVIEFGGKVGNTLRSTFAAVRDSKFAAEMQSAFTTIRSGFVEMETGALVVTGVLGDMARTGLAKLSDAFSSSKFGTAAIGKAKEIGTTLQESLNEARIGVQLYAGDLRDKLGKGFVKAKEAGSAFTTELKDSLDKARIGLTLWGGDAVRIGQTVGDKLKDVFSSPQFIDGSKKARKALQLPTTGFGGKLISEFDSARMSLGLFASDALRLGKSVAAPFISGASAIRGAWDSTAATIAFSADAAFAAFQNTRFAEPLLAGLARIREGFKTVVSGVGDAAKAIGRVLSSAGKDLLTRLKPSLTKARELLGKVVDRFQDERGSSTLAPEAEKAKEPRKRSAILETARNRLKLREQAKAQKAAAEELENESKKTAEGIEQGLVGDISIDPKVGAALEGQLNAINGKLVTIADAGGRKIGEAHSGGIIAAVNANAKGVEAAVAKTVAGAIPRVPAGATAVEPSRSAIKVADQAIEPETIKLKSTKAVFANAGKEAIGAFAQGTLDDKNFEQVVGGGIRAHVNNITNKLAPEIDAQGKKIGGDFNSGILAGVGVNASAVEGVLGKQVADAGGKAGNRLGNAVLSGVEAPFKIIKDLVGTTFRAFLGKGPAEGIGKIGKIAGIALLPVRAFAKATGATLQAGLQLSTTALKVAGAAFAGFVATAIATGVQFNSLQAVVRATLPVILGSAAASEKLLVQVNELNDTSPFARAAFLELTRVLAGFGVEAEKIAPLIDAIQQAVAATGGGEQDLQELGQAFARLQSQGRLSLDIIQSFSSRGIDVIAILGQSFKKTQGEIREMISGGLIPADKAIDALTKGLKEKFDGATDAVAKNLPGALDRVKAKTRDFGGELIRAFVSPTGGGAAIDLLNSFATVVNTITKVFLPLLRPALEGIGAQITNMSDKAASFAKTMGAFESNKIKEFAGGLDGLLGPLAALVAFLPGLLSGIPVIGPMFASLVGGVPAATIAIAAFLLTLKPVRDGLTELFKSLVPIGRGLLTKISGAFKALGDAIGPLVGKYLAALGPILAQVGETLGELFTQLVPIFNAFKRLFEAVSPVIEIIKNGLIMQFKQLQAVLMVIGPWLTKIVEVVASIAEKMQPALQAMADWTTKANEMVSVADVFDQIKTAVEGTSSAFEAFKEKSGGILKAIGLKPLVDLVVEGAQVQWNAVKNLGKAERDAKKKADELRKALIDQFKEVDAVGDKFQDEYNEAAKAVETANAKVSGLTDQVKQQMSAFQGMFDPLIAAGNAVRSAHAAQADASNNAKAAAENVTKVLQDQARALRDVISPTDELAVAERNLTRTKNDLRDMVRQEIELGRQEATLRRELLDLRGEESGDSRAALDRGIERAKIALNKAQKDQNDLLNEGNKAQKTSVSLAGLSLDQVKSRLSAVRASLATQKTTEDKPDKTAQEKADEVATARLDVADATQALKDANAARVQFELDTTEKIRENEEQLVLIGEQRLAIEADRADKLLEERAQVTHILDLKKGETQQAALIKDFEEKIRSAREASAKAAKAITEAIKATTLATLELKAKQAEITGNYEAQWGFQSQINNLKRNGLTFDQATETHLRNQAKSMMDIVRDLRTAQNEAGTLEAQLQGAALSALGGRGLQNDALYRSIAAGDFKGVAAKDIPGLMDLGKSIITALTNVSNSGAIKNRQGETVIFDSRQILDILREVEDALVLDPTADFRTILKRILAAGGWKIPLFASGYAPPLHRGMNDGKGLVRMFEFGKEAVLPLTRKLDMSRIVNNPSVLPRILEALPKVSLPSTAEDPTSVLGSLPRFARPKGAGAASKLSSIRRPSGSASQASTDAARKKEQRDFVSSVGNAVKTAVAEALSESGASFGSDIDINVQPSSNNEVVIAREVKRQIQKALGG